MDVYQKLNELESGTSVFVDLHETLLFGDHFGSNVNSNLISTLIDAQKRGVLVVLWTGGLWRETVHGVELLKRHGLEVDDVITGVIKPNLIIDDKCIFP